MSKYAQANAAGEKPYTVIMWRWGKEILRIAYAETPAGARSKVLPRNGVGEYVLSVKRTTNEEMARATFADFHH